MQTIADTEADGPEAVAVKLAVQWSHVIDHFGEPYGYDELLIRSSLVYLARQTGLDLFVEYDREGKFLLTRHDETEQEGGA